MEKNKSTSLAELASKLITCVGVYGFSSKFILILFVKYVVDKLDIRNIDDIDVMRPISIFQNSYHTNKLNYSNFREVFDVLLPYTYDDINDYHVAENEIYEYIKKQNFINEILNEYEFDFGSDAFKYEYETLFETISNFDISRTETSIMSPSVKKIIDSIIDENKGNVVIYGDGFAVEQSLFNKFSNIDIISFNRFDDIGDLSNIINNRTENIKFHDDPFEVAANEYDLAISPFIIRYFNNSFLYKDEQKNDKEIYLKILDQTYYKLKEKGISIVLVPNSVLYQTGKNQYLELRKYITSNGLKCIINLPSGALNGTGIQTSLIIIEKDYKGNVIFINLNENSLYKTNKNQKIIKDETLKLISDIYFGKMNDPRINNFSQIINKDNILENADCSWNFNTYFISDEKKLYRSVDEINKDIKDIVKKIIDLTK